VRVPELMMTVSPMIIRSDNPLKRLQLDSQRHGRLLF